MLRNERKSRSYYLMNLLFIVPFLFSVTHFPPYPVIHQIPIIAPTVVYAEEVAITSLIDSSRPIKSDNETLIREAIKQYCSSKWQDVALSIAKLENGFNIGQSRIKDRTGPNGREDSWGAVQIHLPDHPIITRKQAQNIDFSIQFLCDNLEKGNGKIWSTFQQALIDNS